MKILITGGNGNIAKIISNSILQNTYEIIRLGRDKLDLLNQKEIEEYFKNNEFDILIHTAINGGRRNKEETSDVVYNNLLMFENLIKYQEKFKMIINLDSGAIYNRKSDILNRKESDILSVPTDYYGFSKYIIYKRSLLYSNMYNFRIFNLFHTNEENDRFIKSCFNAKKNNSDVIIFEDKYFDFVYEDDFISILQYYLDNIDKKENLHKTINICYEEKYRLSDIALIILNESTRIKIINKNSNNNYSGELNKLNIKLDGLHKSLEKYETKYNLSSTPNFNNSTIVSSLP
jgi:nucleoside-diphosphate-sugar epimerase